MDACGLCEAEFSFDQKKRQYVTSSGARRCVAEAANCNLLASELQVQWTPQKKYICYTCNSLLIKINVSKNKIDDSKKQLSPCLRRKKRVLSTPVKKKNEKDSSQQQQIFSAGNYIIF